MFRRWSRRPYSHFQFNICPDQTYFIAIIIGEVIQLFIAKMPSKRRSVRRLRPVEDVPSKISPALIMVLTALSIVGMTMLITNNQLGDVVLEQCPHPNMLGKHVCYEHACGDDTGTADRKSRERNDNYDPQPTQTILIG